MRFPYPERVRYSHAVVFAVVLGALQLIEGSRVSVVTLEVCYILVVVTAFNLAGGFYFPSGAFIGFNSVITLLLPMTAKALLRQPADRNLHAPVRTFEVYLCGAVAMFLGAVITHFVRPRRALISGMLPPGNVRDAYRGALLFAIFFGVLQTISSNGANGSFGSLLTQLNHFPVLSFLLGTISTVYFSKGKTSLTWPLLALMVYGASSGLYTFSKEAFLYPFFCWALGCAYMRFRLSWLNAVCFIVGLSLATTYMVPYAQVGREYQDGTQDPKQLSAYLLSHMDEVRAEYAANIVGADKYHSYDQNVPLLSRLDILAPDDALIDLTDHSGFYGYAPLIASIDNYVPHFIWPNKPPVYYGNTYAHQIGILSDEDQVTGVSFSFASDAYHEGGIFCLLVLCPVLFAFMFTVVDYVVGNTKLNPVGLVLVVLIERWAPETGVPGILNVVQQPLAATIFVAYVAKYILPPMGRFFTPGRMQHDAPAPQPAELAGTAAALPALAAPPEPQAI